MSLDADRYGPAPDLDSALWLAASVGVDRVVQIGCDVQGAQWAVDMANQHARVIAGVALHPNEAPRLAEQGQLPAAFAEIERLAVADRVRAIGETGLDHFRTGPSGRAAQEESFRWHIELAKRLDKALVIHDRDAHEAVVRVLLSQGAPDRVIFHCFSGDAELARICVEHGWLMSFAGTVTFKNAENVRRGLAEAALDLLLVETDAPFLTPAPHRGRPNSPYLIPHTLGVMSQVKRVALADLCQAIDVNSKRVFGAW
jgi:TatD DNase family protein